MWEETNHIPYSIYEPELGDVDSTIDYAWVAIVNKSQVTLVYTEERHGGTLAAY